MITLNVDTGDLGSRLVDDFSRTLLSEAIRIAKDVGNPIRGNLVALVIRELLSHTLHELAPEDDIKKCAWFAPETKDGRPTRAQRQRYLIQGGLSDEYVQNELGLDLGNLRGELSETVKSLNTATHLRPGTILHEGKDVEDLTNKSLSALASLMSAVDHCRSVMMEAISQIAIDETTEEILRETISTIDEVATHHYIEEVYVHEVMTEKIEAQFVWYKATGTIRAELQFGSNSDLRRGDGALLEHTFPFTCQIPAPVDDPKKLDTSMAVLRVDDGGWYGEPQERDEEN